MDNGVGFFQTAMDLNHSGHKLPISIGFNVKAADFFKKKIATIK